MRVGLRLRVLIGAAACTLLVVGCTASGDDGDDGDDGTEVAGAVLDRDDDGEPSPVDDPDDDRVDPREDVAEDDPGDAVVEPDDAGADGDPEEDGSVADEGSSAQESGSGQDPSTPSDPAGDDDGDASPSPASAPSAPPAPEPVTLATGPGLRGDVVGFGRDGAEVLVGGPLDAVPAVGARSDAVRSAPGDEVRCETALQAPRDRGLVGRGDLAIDVLLERHDGGEQRVALLVIDLNVELAAGERFALPESRWRAIDRDEIASVACEARFAQG